MRGRKGRRESGIVRYRLFLQGEQPGCIGISIGFSIGVEAHS
jgi:hypothetical protein